VEFFYARLTAKFDLLAVVDFGDGISHGIEFVAAHKADREGIRPFLRGASCGSAATRCEKEH